MCNKQIKKKLEMCFVFSLVSQNSFYLSLSELWLGGSGTGLRILGSDVLCSRCVALSSGPGPMKTDRVRYEDEACHVFKKEKISRTV